MAILWRSLRIIFSGNCVLCEEIVFRVKKPRTDSSKYLRDLFCRVVIKTKEIFHLLSCFSKHNAIFFPSFWRKY